MTRERNRRIKIVCHDGAADVRILDADTGEDLRFPIERIMWELDAHEGASVTIVSAMPRADIIGELRSFTVPSDEHTNPPFEAGV
jgi:hypothetical protein